MEDLDEEDEEKYDPQFFGPSTFVNHLAGWERVPNLKDVQKSWSEEMKDEDNRSKCLTT